MKIEEVYKVVMDDQRRTNGIRRGREEFGIFTDIEEAKREMLMMAMASTEFEWQRYIDSDGKRIKFITKEGDSVYFQVIPCTLIEATFVNTEK